MSALATTARGGAGGGSPADYMIVTERAAAVRRRMVDERFELEPGLTCVLRELSDGIQHLLFGTALHFCVRRAPFFRHTATWRTQKHQ